jgi:hypothetical protein
MELNHLLYYKCGKRLVDVTEIDDLVLLSVMDMQEVCQCHVTSVAKKGNTTANAMTVNT